MKTTPLYTIKKNQTDFPQTKVQTPKEAADFIRQFYSDDIEIFESCFILLISRNNTTQAFAKISQGGTAGTVVEPKVVAKYAVDSLCSGVIIAHNHPSGNLNPSDQDIAITKKINEGLKLFDIALLDHIILTADGHTSLKESGQM